MTDLHERLASRRRTLQPDPGGFDRLVRRRHIRELRRRVAAGAVAAAITIGVVALLADLRPGREETPAITPDTVASLRVAWTTTVDGSPSAAAIAGDTVFVSADRLSAFPVDCRDGCEPLWTGDIGAPSTTPPVAGDDIVVATSPAGLSAFDPACPADGGACRPLWTAPTPPPHLPDGGVGVDDSVVIGFSEPVVTGGEVITAGPGGVYVFRADCRTDGGACDPSWVGTGTGSSGAPAVGPDGIYVRTHRDLEVFPRTCPTSSCDAAWRADLPDSGGRRVTVAGDLLLIDGVAYRWDGRDLRTVWSAGSISAPLEDLSAAVMAGDVAYLAADRVSAYPLGCGAETTCAPIWSGPVRSAWTEPVVAGGLVFSGTDAPAAFTVGCTTDGSTCEPVWVGSPVTRMSRPAVSSSALVITSADGEVVAYLPAS